MNSAQPLVVQKWPSVFTFYCEKPRNVHKLYAIKNLFTEILIYKHKVA